MRSVESNWNYFDLSQCRIIFMATLFFIFSLCLLLLIWLLRPKCNHCQSRFGFRYKYSRVDGGPDRRYHNNYLICKSCGVSQSNINPERNPATNTGTTKKPWDEIEHPDHPKPKQVVSCHYIVLPGHRKFQDCPDFPKTLGDKCKRCWVINK